MKSTLVCATIVVASVTTGNAASLPRGTEMLGSTEVQRFNALEADQGVTIDDEHFYAIDNSAIGKYDRETGERIGGWQLDRGGPIKHLNSCIVKDKQLVCAHSNYPAVPQASSIEIFDTETMEHVASRSLGIYEGSLTWADWHDGA